MYSLSEQQVDFILNDISARGIEMVSLQQDLLDHICCLVEQELESDGDFECFYQTIIPRFHESDLKEIEVETVNLLTNKHFYTMKKVMITTGALSVGILSVGVFLKFMHLPGAAILILSGVVLMSMVFLPLMFLLRMKEKQDASDRITAVIGSLSAMLISLGILFKIMHWPGANVMCISALLLMLLVFIPVYFFTGIRNPAIKTNTIVSSILMFTGCVLIITLIRAPHASKQEYEVITEIFLRNEEILITEKSFVNILDPESINVYRNCENLKSYLLKEETGQTKLSSHSMDQNALLSDTWINSHFSNNVLGKQKLAALREAIDGYNKSALSRGIKPIPTKMTFLEKEARVYTALNDLIQTQMVVLQNQRGQVAMN